MAIALLCLGSAAQAQQNAPQPPAAAVPTPAPTKEAAPAPEKKEIAKVVISGAAADYDPRRDDTASKTVIHNDEIIKYGDTNVFDVLKRAPGVTVIGNSISMRGLGKGYTQIMVNGERPPPGFSMEALVPEQIEKIEVMRAATAEHSMQAIAGGINIILKKVVAKAQRDLRINTQRSDEKRGVTAIGTLADRKGKLSYYLNAMVAHNVDKTPRLVTDDLSLPDGELVLSRDRSNTQRHRSTMAGVQPRLSWKLDNDGQFNVSGFVQGQRFSAAHDSSTTRSTGVFAQPDYTERTSVTEGSTRFVGGDVNWVAKLAGGKFDTTLRGARGRARNDMRSMSSRADGGTALARDSDSTSHFRSINTVGKFTRTLSGGHSLVTGWDASAQQSDEDSVRIEGLAGRVPERIDETFTPAVTRFAAFVQDEWNVTKQWSVYLGTRWETIRTESEGTGLLTTRSATSVLSPVAQTLYKFPDKSGRQLRLALTRTFKAPDTGQLTARRHRADLNTRFQPDHSGNPDLRPELATGIDLTYEHFWAPGAVFSVAGSARQIKDYIRTKLFVDADGYWLHQPLNDGNAQVRSLDVELKFPLKTVWKGAPAIDVRGSVNRNWSKVDSVPGPDNRLDQQIPLTAVIGADYKGDKLSGGASFAFRSGGPVRLSEQLSGILQTQRDLELYLLYKIRTGLQLRLAVSNALAQDRYGYSRYEDANGYNRSWSYNPGSPRLQANLEMKF